MPIPPPSPYRPDPAGMLVRPSAKLLSLMAVQGSASQIGSASQLVNPANDRWAGHHVWMWGERGHAKDWGHHRFNTCCCLS